MKKKIEFTTPWCHLRKDPRFVDPVYFKKESEDSWWFRPFFCTDALGMWNIPEGAEVRIHVSNYKVVGAQKRVYTAGNLMSVLNNMALDNGLEPRCLVWWYPEVRT